jgi:hypothetical protein
VPYAWNSIDAARIGIGCSPCAPERNVPIFPSHLFHLVSLLPSIDTSIDDGLSTVFGTEALAERDMVPEGFENAPSSFPYPRWLLSTSGPLVV